MKQQDLCELISKSSSLVRVIMSSSKSATKGQRSIVGFFQKKTTILPSHSPNGHREDSSPSTAPNGMARGIKVASRGRKNQGLTPAPSSDALEGVELSGTRDTGSGRNSLAKQLPSPVTPTVKGNGLRGEMIATASSAASSLGSPTRKVCISTFSHRPAYMCTNTTCF